MKLTSKLWKRFFWKLILNLPLFIRVKIIRYRFKISDNLDSEIVFKEAQTKSELEKSFNLLYHLYRQLDYIDDNPDHLHFTKYLTLPTTTILVVKIQDQVIGTMSIVMNSALGLPTENTWDISEYKKNGKNIAEISGLAINQKLLNKKAYLLLPLCKLMYLYCSNILKLDGIIIATTYEVEPFYTDLLLFEKIPNSHGQKHQLVKGNKSSCCFLKIGIDTEENYRSVYGSKKKINNFYDYIFKDNTKNIILPTKMISIQAQLKEKNIAMVELMNEKPNLLLPFSEKDKLIMKNLESNYNFILNYNDSISARNNQRLVTNIKTTIENNKKPTIVMMMNIVDVSFRGFKLALSNQQIELEKDDQLKVKIETHLSTSTFSAKIIWVEKGKSIGCIIEEDSYFNWQEFYHKVWWEIQEIEIKNEIKKAS